MLCSMLLFSSCVAQAAKAKPTITHDGPFLHTRSKTGKPPRPLVTFAKRKKPQPLCPFIKKHELCVTMSTIAVLTAVGVLNSTIQQIQSLPLFYNM